LSERTFAGRADNALPDGLAAVQARLCPGRWGRSAEPDYWEPPATQSLFTFILILCEERAFMSRLRIAGIVAAFALAGCSEETGVTEGTVPFQSGNVDQLAPLKNQMIENMKNKNYMKRPPAEEKSSADSKTSGAAKSPADRKAQEKKQ
jgi:hypothetical protein